MEKIYSIYVYKFLIENQHYAYVGLTKNIKTRDNSHRTDKKSAVYQFCEKHNITPVMKILESNIDKYMAQSKEKDWVNYFQNKGFTILNKSKCGLFTDSLGGIKKDEKTITYHNKPTKRITYEGCFKIASQYEYLSELRTKNNKVYEYARKHGWLNDYTWLKKRQPFKKTNHMITKEEFYQEAKKYKTRTELSLNNKAIYLFGLQNNLLEEVFKKTSYVDIDDKTKQSLIDEANTFKSKKELRMINPQLYSKLSKFGLLGKVCVTNNNVKENYHKISSFLIEDIDMTSMINYKDNFYISNKDFKLYKKLKTKLHSVSLKTNNVGILCFSYKQNKFKPYHDVIIEVFNKNSNYVIYKDSNYENINIKNLVFSNINLDNFKPMKELENFMINREGVIYSKTNKIFCQPEIINEEVYFKSFKVSNLVYKYWSNENKIKTGVSFTVTHKDGNKLNNNISNLQLSGIQNLKTEIVNINLNKEKQYEISIVDGKKHYFIGSLYKEDNVNQAKIEIERLYKLNPSIITWMDEFRLNRFIEIQNNERRILNIEKKVYNNGVYWHKPTQKWKSKIFYNNKEYTLGYFELFDEGKILYEMAVLMLRYDLFENWFQNIIEHRKNVKSLFLRK